MAVVEPKVPIIEHVAEALLCASENGYTFDGWTDEAVTDDLFDCGGVDEELLRDDVLAAVTYLRRCQRELEGKG